MLADHLFIDAILGTDSLRAFRAVIDLEEQKMTLKGTGDVIPLGATRVEETYAASVNSSVCLESGRQALEGTWDGKELFGCAGRRCSRIGRVIEDRENALYGRGWNGVSGSLQRFH
ncbi:hypothetical protein PI125_g20041 [Phytophthora idaei]|nr:hypothetical protein PI125_g20041 [Phytophthora idaei]KAG3135459.1 hypothetical protein PI126_g18245 [Phytophthora idaei]